MNRLFIDSANTGEIIKCLDTGLVDGVTTNPSLLKKVGKNPMEVYETLAMLGIPDISMEVAGNYNEMLKQAIKLSDKFGEVCTVKLPMTPDGLKVCLELAEKGIRTNVTLVFNVAQAVLAAKAGASYVSPFVGRIDDQGYSGLEVVRSIAEIYKKIGSDTQVLAASIRTSHKAVRSIYNGAHIVTMPGAVFWKMYENVLTKEGLQIFEDAYEVIN